MLGVALAWGRFVLLPPSLLNLTITKDGSMFTQVFRASFTAPVADID
jgi:hypothetical protein